jgi:hypothetical protein
VAPVTPPSYLQAGAYSARSDRMTLAALFARDGVAPTQARSGVIPSAVGSDPMGALAVKASATPGTQVIVSAGSVVMADPGGGVYVGHNDAAYTLTPNPASSTLDRIDLVVARFWDIVDQGSSQNAFTIDVQPGTAAGTPVPPAAPALSVPLAEVRVVHGSSTVIANTNITDKRTWSGGVGPAIGVSTARPAQPRYGEVRYEVDTDSTVTYTKQGWRTSPTPQRVMMGASAVTTNAYGTAKITPAGGMPFIAAAGVASVGIGAPGVGAGGPTNAGYVAEFMSPAAIGSDTLGFYFRFFNPDGTPYVGNLAYVTYIVWG